jgi:ABC-type nitrate/sulfonate/bicarbonate transport system permease component
MGRSAAAFNLLEPLLELLRPIPIAAIVPLLMLFLGMGDGLKIGSVAIAAGFPVLINAYAAMKGLSATLRDTGRSFGLSPLQFFVEIALPAAVPGILVGARVALSLSLIVTVFTEMITGNTGMGYFVLNSQQNMAIVDLYVGVIVLAVVGYALNRLFQAIERRVIPWHVSVNHRDG